MGVATIRAELAATLSPLTVAGVDVPVQPYPPDVLAAPAAWLTLVGVGELLSGWATRELGLDLVIVVPNQSQAAAEAELETLVDPEGALMTLLGSTPHVVSDGGAETALVTSGGHSMPAVVIHLSCQ